MKWTEITIKTTTEAVEAVTNILYEQNVGGVSIEDPKDFKFQKKNEYDWDFVEEEIFNSGYDGVIIKTYITEERDVTEDINLIKEKIDGLKEFGIDVGDAIVEISQVDEEDWANEWKNYYKPTKVGEKVVVKPTWEDYEAKEDAINKANADSYVAAYILAGKLYEYDYEKLVEKFNTLGENAKATEPGKTIADRIQKLSAVAVGQVAPDFTLNTPDGKPLSMHSIKGKVKVIDFWASWCGPCRGENPNVVKMYEKFHPKGLEILSVSLDEDKDAWLKAIEDDKLTWNHVSDLKGWQNAAAQLYCVNGIPHLVVLDENNVIVAKDLRGEELQNKVAELLK